MKVPTPNRRTRGVLSPGDNIISLSPEGGPVIFGGTSIAAPFVTGVVALLWPAFPVASAAELLLAVLGTRRASRVAIVPPLLDAWAAHQFMLNRRYTANSSLNQKNYEHRREERTDW